MYRAPACQSPRALHNYSCHSQSNCHHISQLQSRTSCSFCLHRERRHTQKENMQNINLWVVYYEGKTQNENCELCIMRARLRCQNQICWGQCLYSCVSPWQKPWAPYFGIVAQVERKRFVLVVKIYSSSIFWSFNQSRASSKVMPSMIFGSNIACSCLINSK